MNLGLESLIILVIVAALVGALGQGLAGDARGGVLASIALGFIGALIGTWAVREFGLPEIFVLRVGETIIPIIWAIIGAAMFVALLGLLNRGRRS